MRQKGFALLPVIIIIVLLGVVGYFVYQNNQRQRNIGNPTSPSVVPTQNLPKLSPTTDTTINWKIYNRTDAKFSVRYPSDWKVEAADKPLIYILPPDSSTPADGSISISIGNEEKPTTPDWFKNTSPLDPSVYDGSSWAIKDNDTEEIVFWKNHISVLCQPIFSKILTKDIYMQVLSTFKFTQ